MAPPGVRVVPNGDDDIEGREKMEGGGSRERSGSEPPNMEDIDMLLPGRCKGAEAESRGSEWAGCDDAPDRDRDGYGCGGEGGGIWRRLKPSPEVDCSVGPGRSSVSFWTRQ